MVLRNVQPTFTFEEQRVEINELAADVDSINAGYNNTDWDTAFSWGNHATQNYIVNGTFSNVTINAGITTRNLTITDDGSASPIFVSRADDQSVWNLSLQNDAYSTNAGTGTKYFMAADGTAKWYHYGYSAFENTEFYTARVVGSPSSYLAFRLDTFGGSQLMYQGSYRAGSTSWGLNVTGNLYASEGMDIPDGYAFQAGNSDDLRLYHNGSHSYIDNYTGTLYINNFADNQNIQFSTDDGSGGSATYILCNGSDGSVTLGHYGTARVVTAAGGVNLYGTVTSDPTATNVAGYAYEVKNGATSLGGLYKTSSNGGFLQLNNGAGTLKASINGEDGSAAFDGNTTIGAPDVADANTGGVQIFASGQLRIQRDSAGTASDKRFQMYYGTTETASITADGAATFTGAINANGGINLGDSDVANFGAGNDLQISHNGSHSFIEDTGTGNLYFRSNGAGLIVDTASGGSIMARFLNGNAVDLYYNGDKKFETTATGVEVTGTGTFSGVLTAGQRLVVNQDGTKSGTQLTFLNYAGDASTVTASLSADGDVSFSGILQTNTKSAGNIELDSTGAFTSPPLKLYSTSGNIESDNPNGDTTLSIGDRTNNNGRLILTSKANTVEIHSRSNHPIEFLFNTTTKTKMTIDGGLNFEATGAGIVFDWQTQASGATSDKLDHYEEGTWTPVIDRATTAPTVAYNYNTGKYTRIGNVVTIYFDISMSSVGGGSGVFRIGGLPFASVTDSNSGGYGSPQFRNSDAFTVEMQERPSSYHSGDYINLRYTNASNGEDDMTVGPGRITGWSVYFVG